MTSPSQTQAPPPACTPFFEKWWTYQRERFPIFAHGALIASFSFCAVSLSRMLRGAPGLPPWPQLLVAFVTCFTFFLQLRIADEFKDYEEDARYRPYRPVQRGLVTLRELAVAFIVGAVIQLVLALWLMPRLLILLSVTWAYLAAMSKEFFVAGWLRQRYLLYLASHMVIMPLVDLYATSTDWLVAGSRSPPSGLIIFLLASYFNGVVIEIGRKIRSPEDEELGVATYSRVWGRSNAVGSWWAAMALTFVFAIMVSMKLRLGMLIGLVLLCGVIGGLCVGAVFLGRPIRGRGKWVETCSGVWTLLLYLSLGLLPRLLGILR